MATPPFTVAEIEGVAAGYGLVAAALALADKVAGRAVDTTANYVNRALAIGHGSDPQSVAAALLTAF